MRKTKLYFGFFLSTLFVNLGTSVVLCFLVYMGVANAPVVFSSPPPVWRIYVSCCMIGGPWFSLLHKEMTHKNEYYFYYNQGLSKVSMIAGMFGIYLVSGIVILLIF